MNEKFPQRRPCRCALVYIPDSIEVRRLCSERKAVDKVLHSSIAEPVVVDKISENIQAEENFVGVSIPFYHFDSRVVRPVDVQPKVANGSLRQSYDFSPAQRFEQATLKNLDLAHSKALCNVNFSSSVPTRIDVVV